MTTAAPTLEMVAAAAGVSRSTVSRVVNASPNVTPEAIAAVSKAIEELGYVPNRAARILASRRTFSIALVIPENTAKFFADPYFASVVQGVAMHLSATDYTLTLLIAADPSPPYFDAGLRQARMAYVRDLRSVVLPGNHHLHLENPAPVAEAVRAFLAA